MSLPIRCAAPAAAALLAACGCALAQDARVVITGNPLRQNDFDAPSSVLAGRELLLRRGTTLGDTLAGLPGVTQATFGPQASRPVLRGQDGDRIRLLSNGGASLDASALGADHAVPLDPLVVERVEVLRGPAALLYGGNAAGGVVNLIDNRIPGAAIGRSRAVLEARGGGAAGERAVSALAEADALGLSWHADGFERRTQDLRVPAFAGADGQLRRRVANAAAETRGGALGAAWVGRDGHLGLSVDGYRNDYGTVVEEDVRIRLRRDRVALGGEWRGAAAAVPVVRWQASRQDYRHDEVEGDGAVGTRWRSRGADARVEATHRPLAFGAGTLEGAFGVQLDTSRLAADGEEAFLPATRTRQAGVFLVEHWRSPTLLRGSVGVRAETVRSDSQGDAPAATEPRFGAPVSRRFAPRQAAVGLGLPLAPALTLTLEAARTERAPSVYELFADGVHVATGLYERGDPSHRTETGRSAGAALQWRRGGTEARLTAFAQRFSRYLVLLPTGEPDAVDDDGASRPVQAFTAVRARLAGAEVQLRHAFDSGGSRWEFGAGADAVRGDNRSAGEPLPRLAPWRADAHAQWQRGAWQWRVEVQHAAAQRRVPAADTPTPAWTQWHASVLWEGRLGDSDVQLFVRGRNLGNALAYNAAALPVVRALAPLPGRGVTAGLRVSL